MRFVSEEYMDFFKCPSSVKNILSYEYLVYGLHRSSTDSLVEDLLHNIGHRCVCVCGGGVGGD